MFFPYNTVVVVRCFQILHVVRENGLQGGQAAATGPDLTCSGSFLFSLFFCLSDFLTIQATGPDLTCCGATAVRSPSFGPRLGVWP